MPVVLRDVADRTYEDIAGSLGVPVGTVRSRLHRGRRMLRTRARQERSRGMSATARRPAVGVPQKEEPDVHDQVEENAPGVAEDEVVDDVRHHGQGHEDERHRRSQGGRLPDLMAVPPGLLR